MSDPVGTGGLPPNVTQLPYANTASTASHSGGGGAGGGGDESLGISMKDYVDAQVEKTNAQNEARFARVETKLNELKIPSIWQFISIAAGAVIAIVGLNALMADRFEGGIGVGNVLEPMVETQKERDLEQDQKLDKILATVEQIRDNPEGRSQNGQD